MRTIEKASGRRAGSAASGILLFPYQTPLVARSLFQSSTDREPGTGYINLNSSLGEQIREKSNWNRRKVPANLPSMPIILIFQVKLVSVADFLSRRF